MILLLLLTLPTATEARDWIVDSTSPRANDNGAGNASDPFRTIAAGARAAQPGDSVVVHGGTVYRERIAPPRNRVTYEAAVGSPRPIVRGSEPLPAAHWKRVATDGNSVAVVWVGILTGLPFERMARGTFNPYNIRLASPGKETVWPLTGSPGSSCLFGHTLGQVFDSGNLLTEVSGARTNFHCCTGSNFNFHCCTGCGHGCPGEGYKYGCGGHPCGLDVNCNWSTAPICDDNVCGCSKAGQLAGCCNFTSGSSNYSASTVASELSRMSWFAAANGTQIWARFNDETSEPSEVDVTVRRRVFAPHIRGLGDITVRGFILEHAATQWDDGFWVRRSQPLDKLVWSAAALATTG